MQMNKIWVSVFNNSLLLNALKSIHGTKNINAFLKTLICLSVQLVNLLSLKQLNLFWRGFYWQIANKNKSVRCISNIWIRHVMSVQFI